MVGRIARKIFPLVRKIWVAIFAHPGSPCQKLVIAAHVQQRDLADNGSKQIGSLHQHVPHQKPSIGAPSDSQMIWGGHLAPDQIFGNRDEIIVGSLTMFLQGGLMPSWPKLTATANIGHHINPSLFQPTDARYRPVTGTHGNLKTSVSIKEGRGLPIMRHITRGDLKIRNVCAIR